jgi:hypothetical protein
MNKPKKSEFIEVLAQHRLGIKTVELRKNSNARVTYRVLCMVNGVPIAQRDTRDFTRAKREYEFAVATSWDDPENERHLLAQLERDFVGL